MARDDTEDIKKLKKTHEEVQTQLNDMAKAGRGYSTMIERQVINPDITELDLDNFGINNVASIQDTLFNIKGRDKVSRERISDLIYADLYADKSGRQDLAQLSRMRMQINLEYNYILNNMIEMNNALNQLADDVVFPNSSIQSGLKVEFIGNRDTVAGERYEDLIKFLRPLEDITSSLRARRIFNFDLETETKQLVKDVATYGYQIACTIPYKSIVTDLLYKADKMNYLKQGQTSKGESYCDIEDLKSFAEDMHNIYVTSQPEIENLESNDLLSSKISIIGESSKELHSILSDTFYSSTDIDQVVQYLKDSSENANLFQDIDMKGATADISSPIDLIAAKEGMDDHSSQEVFKELKEKKNRRFILDNIKGCTYEVLDINKVQPVFIKDELIGAYVVEHLNEADRFRLGTTLTNILGASNLEDGISINDGYKEKVRKVLLQDVRSILERNLNKSFLRNNPNLIEDIQWILDAEGEDNIMNERIRFIPGEYLTLFKRGKGPLGQSMLSESKVYAMMHIQLLKANTLDQVFYKPRYNLKVRDNGDLSSRSTISQAVNYVRNTIPRLSDVGIPDTMTDSLLANYQTVITQMNPNGDSAVEVDTIPLMEPRDVSELLRYLRNQATLPIGYPADLLDPSQTMDFAKKISNINAYTLLKVISMQQAMTISLSELITKRMKYMTGLDQLEAKVEFIPPKDTYQDLSLESLDKVTRMLESYEVMIDNNNEIRDDEKDIMKAKLTKKLLGEYLDMEILNQTHDEVIVEGKHTI